MQLATLHSELGIDHHPYKNAAPWIEETIDSICGQSHSNWELLCVNDDSTDDSPEIVSHLSERDPRILKFTNPGKGIIPVLQFGLEMSKGDFITRMDADDIMPTDRLALFRQELDQDREKTVVTGKVRYFADTDISEGYRKYEAWLNERVRNDDYYDHIYRECVVASPNWMARKEHLVNERIFDDLIYPEDYCMTLLWFDRGFKIRGVDQETLFWREHPKRTSRNSTVYRQRSFFRLKLEHFAGRFGKSGKSIGILGAGKKGKLAAEILTEHNISFNWYDLNAAKFDGNDHNIQDPCMIDEDLLLLAVYPEKRNDLEEFLRDKNYFIGKNAWYL